MAQISFITQGILDSISTNNSSLLSKLLNSLPINKISNNKGNDLLVKFLSTTALFKYPTLSSIILDYYDENSFNNNISTYTYSYSLVSMPDETLKFLASNLPNYTFVDSIDELINYDPSDLTRLATQRLVSSYNIPQNDGDIQNLKILIDLADENDNDAVSETLQSTYVLHSPFAPKPVWMGNFTGDDEIPYEDEIEIPDELNPIVELPPTLEESVDLLTAGMHQFGYSQDQIETSKMELMEKLSQLPPQEVFKIVKPVLLNNAYKYDEDNIILFRILGPVNNLYNQSLDANDYICTKYGGCRMFTCICFDTIDPYDDSITQNYEWFLGYCQQCLNRIQNKFWAVRKPLVDGGWIGCFCSWDCVRESIDKPDIALREIINASEEQLIKIGIQERLPVPKDDDYFVKINDSISDDL
jgi:hypothetical protein